MRITHFYHARLASNRGGLKKQSHFAESLFRPDACELGSIVQVPRQNQIDVLEICQTSLRERIRPMEYPLRSDVAYALGSWRSPR